MQYRAPRRVESGIIITDGLPQVKHQKTPSPSSSWSEIVDVWRADANKRVAELVEPKETPHTKVVRSMITDDTLHTTCHVNSIFMDTSRTKSRLDSEFVHHLIWTWPSTLADSIGMVPCILDLKPEGKTARTVRHDAGSSDVLSWMKCDWRPDINVKGHHENMAIQWAKHWKMTIRGQGHRPASAEFAEIKPSFCRSCVNVSKRKVLTLTGWG